MEKLIKPALERGEWVVCDRFTDSTHAYQGYGEGMKDEFITGLHKLVLGNFLPDFTIIFDMDIDKALQRAQGREKMSDGQKEDRYERMGGIFHKNVRRGFLEIAKKNKERCVVVNADGTISKIHEVAISNLNFYLKTKTSPLSPIAIDGILR